MKHDNPRYVVYGRIWDKQNPVPERAAQIEDAAARMAQEEQDWRVIGHHFDVEPTTRYPALKAAAQMAREARAAIVMTALEGIANNSHILRHILWARCPVAFVEIPREIAPLEPMRGATLRVLRRFSKGKLTTGVTPIRPPASSVEDAQAAAIEAARVRRLELAPAVQEAFASEGTYAAAARALNDAGISTLSGEGQWHPQTVKRVLEEAQTITT